MKSNRDSGRAASIPRDLGITPAAQLLNQGLALHQLGRFEEAERAYRKAVASDNRMADAHHLLGAVLHQQGRSAEGLRAIDQAIKRAPQSAAFQLSRGAVLATLGLTADAAGAFRRTLGARPGDALAFRNLATAAIGLDQAVTALAASRRASILDQRDPIAWTARAHAARKLGHAKEAADACRRALAVDSGQDEARFLLASLEGEPDRPPAGYVRGLFDKFAPHFDRDLVDRLDYRTPEALAELIARHLAPAPKSLTILDLGCGTGLAGVALTRLARRLTGLDLSPGMLAQAKRRGLYAELIEADLVTAAFPQAFDLVVAADVLNYLGDLAPAFASIDAALAPGGALAFSIETLSSNGTYRLTSDLRYAHAPDHVRALASMRGWTERAAAPAVLRRQGDAPVEGLLFLFSKG
ncbi:MAG: methyltransferase domain-containing protein [Alphaproteobacteria bacterium]|nr:methyltransferase domain-containing protein [Alphaproteobacteria bacterium]